ncbi:methionyl-tRNA formyltransferase [Candidatus Oleimmundimicrobium sp.]|uniref:methionyl-tRNA formyltransferase n=1 Tax=Candidatus Oleimmundimicrobium sp. TaxID=3060597 RepID=UPI00271906A4|nr:methionyl-tRNA formyltransferase [Candidatus Oleimmundimicrobium sp.]MDO8885381.1 methionyl-tRNA formyltransferase [Candidatus Oleimmundimicrobium sp.]
MKIIFAGTPKFALPSLKTLLNSHHEIIAIITQPDRPRGRHLKLMASPIKKMAISYKIPVFQPLTLNNEEFKEKIVELKPDIVIVVAFGQLIPQWLLNLPKYGCVNAHASLLPKYRGAAPIQRVIMDGSSETGVTTMFMDNELDTGDILLQTKVSISDDETAGELHDKLAELSSNLLLKTIDGLDAGTIKPIRQNDTEASFAPKIKDNETKINWGNSAEKIRNIIRALNPTPGAHTLFKGKRLKIFKVETVSPKNHFPPGTISEVEKNIGFMVNASDKALLILEVQPEGKRIMAANEFCKGHNLKKGDRVE